jgi:hypothetical protein
LIEIAERTDSHVTFDICLASSYDLANVSNGFLASPNYPAYYGNDRNCQVNIKVAPRQLLHLYVYTQSIERMSLLTNRVKDYLLVQGERKLYGTRTRPDSVEVSVNDASETERTLELRFVSDFVTLERLAHPKGFLVYFECSETFSFFSAASLNKVEVIVFYFGSS